MSGINMLKPSEKRRKKALTGREGKGFQICKSKKCSYIFVSLLLSVA